MENRRRWMQDAEVEIWKMKIREEKRKAGGVKPPLQVEFGLGGKTQRAKRDFFARLRWVRNDGVCFPDETGIGIRNLGERPQAWKA
jgi:hypothetical protein